MFQTVSQEPDLFASPAYLPRVTRYDARAIGEVLGGATLFDAGIQLPAAIIDATYAAEESPLLKRLREATVPRLIDPQTLRFIGRGFLGVKEFERLPYRPTAPITVDDFPGRSADAFARMVLRFEQASGATWFLAPALPVLDNDVKRWLDHNTRLLSAACAANGGSDLDRRPMFAQVAPGRALLARPELAVERLLDQPIDGVYVQPTRFNASKASVDALAQYARFLLSVRAAGLPVIASRMGAFGLVLASLGIEAFDSGLAQAEACDLASQLRAPKERSPGESSPGGGADRRTYVERLKTTIQGRHARELFAIKGLRARFTCSLACCRHRGFEDLPTRRRQHYLWTRDQESAQLRERPTLPMRQALVHEQLLEAVETSRVVRRALLGKVARLPEFGHLDRWRVVLEREGALSKAA